MWSITNIYKLDFSNNFMTYTGVEQIIKDSFKRGKWENEWRPFTDGMDSNFTSELTNIVLQYGNKAIKIISNIMEELDNKGSSIDIIHEVLLFVGHLEDTDTHESRRLMLEKFLRSKNISTRDSASLGIDAQGDPKSHKAVEEAIIHETDEWQINWLKELRDLLY